MPANLSPSLPQKGDTTPSGLKVVPLRTSTPTDALVAAGVRAGSALAREQLFDRYAASVRGVLVRLLGFDSDLEDLVQDVFVEVLRSLHRLEDAARLKGFIAGIAVNIARGRIRRASRRRWLSFYDPGDLPPIAVPPVPPEHRNAASATYRILEGLSTEERIAFSLRYLEGMELTDVAESMGLSLSTAKRRIRRGRDRFMSRAASEPALDAWVSMAEPANASEGEL